MTSAFYEYGLLPRDIASSRRKQKKFISAEIEQNLRDLKRVQDFNETLGQIMTPTKFEAPIAEQLKDRNLQRKRGEQNALQILEDPDEVQSLLANLTDEQIGKFNRYAPSIIEDTKKRFTNITADFLKKYIENYIRRQEETGNLIQYYFPRVGEVDRKSVMDEYRRLTGNTLKPKKWSEDDIQTLTRPIGANTRTKSSYEKKMNALNQAYAQIQLEIADIRASGDPAGAVRLGELENFRIRIENTMDDTKAKARNVKPQGFILTSIKDASQTDVDEVENALESAGAPPSTPMMGSPAPSALFPEDEDEDEDEDEEEEEDEEDLLGRGLGRRLMKRGIVKGKGMSSLIFLKGKRPIMGRGLMLEEPNEKFVPFGKFVINYPSLEDGFLQIKYPSTGTIPHDGFRRKMRISSTLKDFMIDLIEKKKMSPHKFNKLNEDDKTIFKNLSKLSRLNRQLGINDENNEIEVNNDEDEKRFQVLIGQIKAGNDNKDLKRQLILLLSKFILEGRIDKKQGEEIIQELI